MSQDSCAGNFVDPPQANWKPRIGTQPPSGGPPSLEASPSGRQRSVAGALPGEAISHQRLLIRPAFKPESATSFLKLRFLRTSTTTHDCQRHDNPNPCVRCVLCPHTTPPAGTTSKSVDGSTGRDLTHGTRAPEFTTPREIYTPWARSTTTQQRWVRACHGCPTCCGRRRRLGF